MSIVLLITACLVDGTSKVIAKLTSHTGKEISEALAGDNPVDNMTLLRGQTLGYKYHPDIAKSHLADISKTISQLQPVYGYTSYKGETDKTLSVPIVNKKSEFTDKFKLVLPHLSDDKINELNSQLDKVKTIIARFNKQVTELQPLAEFSFTLYCKDGETKKLEKAVADALLKAAAEAQAKNE